jgi:hypothetical protein
MVGKQDYIRAARAPLHADIFAFANRFSTGIFNLPLSFPPVSTAVWKRSCSTSGAGAAYTKRNAQAHAAGVRGVAVVAQRWNRRWEHAFHAAALRHFQRHLAGAEEHKESKESGRGEAGGRSGQEGGQGPAVAEAALLHVVHAGDGGGFFVR